MTSEQLRKRLVEFSRGRLLHRAQFNVNPRFTYYGTPPDLDTALRRAQWERDEYAAALEGLYGEEHQARAKRLGLGSGIIEILYETRKCWDVLDLITGERRLRPFAKVA